LKIIERKYCDESIVGALKKIASLLSGWKAVGPYQIGHLAAAALFLVRDQAALENAIIVFSVRSCWKISDTDKSSRVSYFSTDPYCCRIIKGCGL